MSPLQKAIDLAGSQVALARKIGCSQQVVNNWLRRKRVPPFGCISIERATGVTCEELRPDLADYWAYLRNSTQHKEAA